MKYCCHCGSEVEDNVVVCLKCGCYTEQTRNGEKITNNDSISVGLAILSWFIPLFGIIYWPIVVKDRPTSAVTFGVVGLFSMLINSIIYYSVFVYIII